MLGLLKVVYKKCQFVVLKNSCVLLLKEVGGWFGWVRWFRVLYVINPLGVFGGVPLVEMRDFLRLVGMGLYGVVL